MFENEQEISIPNTDFKNKHNLLSLSYCKLKGGYLLRENISGERLPISGFGLVATHITGMSKQLLDAVKQVSDQCKVGEIFTITVQITKGSPGIFGAGSGMLIQDSFPQGPTNFFGQQMQTLGFAIGLTPDFINKFKPDHEGWIQFTASPEVKNNPNLNKPLWSMFNPYGNGPGMSGMPIDDPFMFMPTVDQTNGNKAVIVSEDKHPDGSIVLK